MSVHCVSTLNVPEGDGLTVRRLMPVHGLRNFDPFVLWDHFDIAGGGFPPHPHRGFEAITYLFAGGMRHKDNLGNEGTVEACGAQRFTAGRGIVHSEMPDGRAAGIQLWINLPGRLKGIDPDYQQVEGVPSEQQAGTTIRHIVSDQGPIRLHTEVEYLDVSLAEGAAWQRTIPAGFRGIVYIVEGQLTVADQPLESGQAALVENEAQIAVAAASEARLMWCFGKPLGEPIHQHGPFVD